MQDDNDPAILVVKSLIESYPKVDAKLFIGELLIISFHVLFVFMYTEIMSYLVVVIKKFCLTVFPDYSN